MQTEGIHLIFGVKGFKSTIVKICVIERVENENIKLYGFTSTGNFNELTACFYTDVTLFTHNQKDS
jgi:polyphosphate kinase